MNRTLPLLAAALVACSNPVDSSENVLPYLSERDTTVAEVSTGGSCDCLAVGQWFRFDTLALTSIGGDAQHPVVSTLNTLWQGDIDADELNILAEVVEVGPTEVKTRVANGARVDFGETICVLEDTSIEVTFPRDGCRLALSEAAAFNVYAGAESYPKNCTTTLPIKHAIPVAGARLEGTVSDTCGAITGGTLPEGVLGEAELNAVCTCLVTPGEPAETCGELEPGFTDNGCVGCNANYQSLGGLLVAFGGVEFDCAMPDSSPGTCITAEWTAAALPAAPPSCGE